MNNIFDYTEHNQRNLLRKRIKNILADRIKSGGCFKRSCCSCSNSGGSSYVDNYINQYGMAGINSLRKKNYSNPYYKYSRPYRSKSHNSWLDYVNKYQQSHPNLSYKQVLKNAKKSYGKKSGGIFYDDQFYM